MRPLREALALLREVREGRGQTAIAVSYSGGKDSMAVLWLCTRIFERVEAFFLYTPVEGLRCVEEPAFAFAKRLGVNVHTFPDPYFVIAHREAHFMPYTRPMPNLDFADIWNAMREVTGCEWIANGWRSNDSMDRMITIKQHTAVNDSMKTVMPLASWKDADVYDLLRHIKAKRPLRFGKKRISGPALNADCLVTLKRSYPDDYARVLKVYPHAEAICFRSERFGLGHYRNRFERRDDRRQEHLDHARWQDERERQQVPER
jgi:phosphoadenosine phosphosulfate reductase